MVKRGGLPWAATSVSEIRGRITGAALRELILGPVRTYHGNGKKRGRPARTANPYRPKYCQRCPDNNVTGMSPFLTQGSPGSWSIFTCRSLASIQLPSTGSTTGIHQCRYRCRRLLIVPAPTSSQRPQKNRQLTHDTHRRNRTPRMRLQSQVAASLPRRAMSETNLLASHPGLAGSRKSVFSIESCPREGSPS